MDEFFSADLDDEALAKVAGGGWVQELEKIKIC